MGERFCILSYVLRIWQCMHVFDLSFCSFLRFMTSVYRSAARCLEIHEPWYVAYVLAYASVLNTALSKKKSLPCLSWRA